MTNLPSPPELTTYPTHPPEAATALGSTLVLIPHPDDESLGCGGLLALLRQANLPVWCVLVSDGTMSHPNSQKFSASARQHLREEELRAALRELAVPTADLQTLELPDGAVPTPKEATGVAAVEKLVAILQQYQPDSVLVPWRRDPHPDHRATSALALAALAHLTHPPRMVEYVVWAWERASPTDLPQPGEVQGWQLDISPVLRQKQRAIACHRSQLPGSPIDDDPAGFTLAPSMLAHFSQPTEVFLEASGG
ncbi:PIG-L deacetylase family protein [Hymenobacter sp. AT01-02]|uniref:PIG-L deacetylase family protein n=1 Tax=Hymenobacter sp. AT01-02 TaxID=1571877 RepID=UPI0005F18A13|nr:PIG-L deacetylase family protein [Hymenobacter sp. AT01-02]